MRGLAVISAICMEGLAVISAVCMDGPASIAIAARFVAHALVHSARCKVIFARPCACVHTVWYGSHGGSDLCGSHGSSDLYGRLAVICMEVMVVILHGRVAVICMGAARRYASQVASGSPSPLPAFTQSTATSSIQLTPITASHNHTTVSASRVLGTPYNPLPPRPIRITAVAAIQITASPPYKSPRSLPYESLPASHTNHCQQGSQPNHCQPPM